MEENDGARGIPQRRVVNKAGQIPREQDAMSLLRAAGMVGLNHRRTVGLGPQV